jgi:hypothetical protein
VPSTGYDLFYGPDYVRAAYDFDTTRKARWIAESLVAEPIAGVRLVEPAPLTFDEVAAVHDRRYVQAVRDGTPRELAESQGFQWDEGLWRMVLATNGGVVAAARSALECGVAGSLSSGLHHARWEHGSGNCTLNGIVLAAHAALDAGATSVLRSLPLQGGRRSVRGVRRRRDERHHDRDAPAARPARLRLVPRAPHAGGVRPRGRLRRSAS